MTSKSKLSMADGANPGSLERGPGLPFDKKGRIKLDADVTVDVDTLATLFLITAHRVGDLERGGYIIKTREGSFPLIEAVNGFVRYLREQSKKTEENKRWTAARAEMSELKMMEARGELIRASQVEERWGEAMMKFRMRILSLHQKAAPLCANQDAQTCSDVIGGLLEEALAELNSGFFGQQQQDRSDIGEVGSEHPAPAA